MTFQFTTSQGGRRETPEEVGIELPFNSRPHKEVDGVFLQCWSDLWLSIHDLTRRSTVLAYRGGFYNNLSIHDLTRRSTTFCRSLWRRSAFQFTTSQGGRPISATLGATLEFFQFTTSQGGRLLPQVFRHRQLLFQFTTSQGGRRFLRFLRLVL